MIRRNLPFDASLIFLQICSFQAVFYLGYIITVFILDSMFSIPFSYQQILDYSVIRITGALGRISIIGLVVGGLCAAITFVFLEGHSRKAFDFITTTFVIHIIVTTTTYSAPISFYWWVFTIISWISSTFVAEHFSMKRELQDIDIVSLFGRGNTSDQL